MEKYWSCQSSWGNQSFGWSINVGHITSSSEEAVFRAVLLHPSTVYSFHRILSTACWRLYFQHSCRRDISFPTWSLSEILAITNNCQHNLGIMPSMRNSRIGSLKASKYYSNVIHIFYVKLNNYVHITTFFHSGSCSLTWQPLVASFVLRLI